MPCLLQKYTLLRLTQHFTTSVVLCCAVLCCAVLCCAVLCCVFCVVFEFLSTLFLFLIRFDINHTIVVLERTVSHQTLLLHTLSLHAYQMHICIQFKFSFLSHLTHMFRCVIYAIFRENLILPAQNYLLFTKYVVYVTLVVCRMQKVHLCVYLCDKLVTFMDFCHGQLNYNHTTLSFDNSINRCVKVGFKNTKLLQSY